MARQRRHHRYTVELYRRGAEQCLGTAPVTPDFEPALEWASFWTVRRDRERPLVLDGQYSWLEPCWDAHLGQPYLNGLRAMVAAEARPAVAVHIPLSYFSELARAASAPLIASGKLAKGDIVEFRVCAYPDERHELEDGWADELLSVRPEPQNIALDDRDMDDFLADSDACGRIDVDEMPVFIPRELLSDVAGLMLHAGASETGGILVGHLHRDRRRREIFLEVTAQVPAEHAQHELTRLTFTPDTWAAADAVLALRGRREIYVGWWHTHPTGQWCDQCPTETQAECRAAGNVPGDFFSVHDTALHRAVFHRAYNVALVLRDRCSSGSNPVRKLYGWHYGMVQSRGHYVFGAGPLSVVAPPQQEGEAD